MTGLTLLPVLYPSKMTCVLDFVNVNRCPPRSRLNRLVSPEFAVGKLDEFIVDRLVWG